MVLDPRAQGSCFNEQSCIVFWAEYWVGAAAIVREVTITLEEPRCCCCCDIAGRFGVGLVRRCSSLCTQWEVGEFGGEIYEVNENTFGKAEWEGACQVHACAQEAEWMVGSDSTRRY
jgi:hypothetical protein